MSTTRRQILRASGLSLIVGAAGLTGFSFAKLKQPGPVATDAAVLNEFRQGNVVIRDGIVVAPSESESAVARYKSYFATKPK